jgi:hypothetical protein
MAIKSVSVQSISLGLTVKTTGPVKTTKSIKQTKQVTMAMMVTTQESFQ